MSPRGLGRGLSALIPGAPASEVTPPSLFAGGVRTLPPARIHPNPLQPRRAFPPEALAQLVASVREHGILQPLVVASRSDGEYELIAGERRLRAAKSAGLAEVPVVVREVAPDDRAKLELALIENIQRQDLNPIERALAFRRLQESFALTQEVVAQRVGIARSSVAHALRLLTLPQDMQDAVASGALSEGHAKVLAGMTVPSEQRAWFARIIAEKLPIATVVRAEEAKRQPAGSQRKHTDQRDPNIRAKELALQRQLGAKVRIAADANGGGAITIAFSDPEELQGILRAILRS